MIAGSRSHIEEKATVSYFACPGPSGCRHLPSIDFVFGPVTAENTMTLTPSNCSLCGAEVRPGMVRCRKCGGPRNGGSQLADGNSKSALISANSRLAAESVATVAATTSAPKPHARPSGSHHRRTTTRSAAASPTPAAKFLTASPPLARHVPRQPWYRRKEFVALALLLVGIVAVTATTMTRRKGIAPVETTGETVPLTPDRAAAFWVVDNFGVVTAELKNGDEAKFVSRTHLPDEPFAVTKIDLRNQTIDGNQLAFLGSLPRLMELDLSKTGVTDDHMSLIAAAANLEKLALRGGSITASGYSQLSVCEKMANFTASGNKAFTDDSLSLVIEKMPNLRMILLASTSVTDAGFARLASLKSLREVRIENLKISDAAVAELTKQLPKCKLRQ